MNPTGQSNKRILPNAAVAILICFAFTSVRAQQTTPAQKTAQAKAHFGKAETKYRLGAFAEALEGYKKALALVRSPGIVFNIAQCYRKLSDAKQGIFYYELYLTDWARANPNKPIPFADEVRAYIVELKQAQKQQKLLEEQKREREAKAEREAQEKRLADEKRKKEEEQRAKEAEDEAARQRMLTAQVEAQRGIKKTWAYGALGLCAAAAVTAAVLYGVGMSNRSAAEEAYLATTEDDQAGRDLHWAEVQHEEKKIWAAHAMSAVSAAALGLSIYQFLTMPKEETKKRVSFDVGPRGILVRGTF